jgi:GxxExxY protein
MLADHLKWMQHEATTSTKDARRWRSPIACKGLPLEVGHRLDLLVEDLVIVELKSVERLELVHQLQLLSGLRRMLNG